MKAAAKRVGLKAYAPRLLADLALVAAGGEITPPLTSDPDILAQAIERVAWKGPGYYLAEGGEAWADDASTATAGMASRLASYEARVCDFLREAPLAEAPGATPLEKAASLLKLLAQLPGGQPGREGEDSLPIFQEGAQEAGEVARSLEEAIDLASELSAKESEMLYPDGSPKSPEGDGSRGGSGDGLKGLPVMEDLLRDTAKRFILQASRKLDERAALKVRRLSKLVPDPNGRDVRYRPIRGLNELTRIPKGAWALATQAPALFMAKAMTGGLMVRERVTRIEKRQLLWILIDGSGSMKGTKHHKATGVVLNRLRAAVDGDAEVHVSMFDTQVRKTWEAKTPAAAREALRAFRKENFSGGGTNVAAAVKETVAKIEKAMASGTLARPEIFVLTDEDTSAEGVSVGDLHGTVVHGFAMESENPGLRKLAQASGGQVFENF